MTAETIDTATFGQEWAAWHRQHETVRADPHGFLPAPAELRGNPRLPEKILPEAGQTPPERP